MRFIFSQNRISITSLIYQIVIHFFSKWFSYKEAIDQCAKKCIVTQYMCNSFVIIAHKGGRGTLCMKFVTTASDLSWEEQQNDRQKIIAVYDLREPRKFDILTVLSNDIGKKSGEQWTNHLLQGYGIHPEAPLKEIFYVPFLLGCRKSAMYGQPSRGVDFDSWLAKGVALKNHIHGPEERLRKYNRISRETDFGSRVFNFKEDEMGWQLFPDDPNNDPSSDIFESFVLDFLDIFSRTISRGITTIYDPEKKILFIEENDLHLLIVSVGSGEYIVIREGPNNDHSKEMNPLSGTKDERNQKEQSALKMFKLAMRHSGHTMDSSNPQVRFVATQNVRMSVIHLVIDVAGYVMEPACCSARADSTLLPFAQLTGDLVEFVLFKVYGEGQEFQSELSESGKQRHFESSMANIITTNK